MPLYMYDDESNSSRISTRHVLSSYINALRRFVARQGSIKHIYSNNGFNFVGTSKLLKICFSDRENKAINNYLRQNGIVWFFNPLQASHMGSVWERMVRTVKKVLLVLAVMSSRTLSDDDLFTILSEVESIVNLCPLIDVSLKKGEETPLTLNLLLMLNFFVVPLVLQ